MILEMILDGKLYPAEQIVIPNEKYMETQQKAGQLLQELEKALAPANRAKLEQYLDYVLQAHSITAEEYLKYGFALGVRLMKEAEDIPYFQESA